MDAVNYRERFLPPDFFREDFRPPVDFLLLEDFRGTFAPFLRASESPMAIACLRLVTFLPLRPDLSVPFFLRFIALSTRFEAALPYFLPCEDFLAAMRLSCVDDGARIA
jgi:hypothetical protein